jgi:hypothetical protein
MLILQFGAIRPHESGDGIVGEYALHIQGPWRLDDPGGTITGRGDLWDYTGPGLEPAEWSYEDGHSLQDERFNDLLGPREEVTHSCVNEADRLVVTAAQHESRRRENRADRRLRHSAVSRWQPARGLALVCAERGPPPRLP